MQTTDHLLLAWDFVFLQLPLEHTEALLLNGAQSKISGLMTSPGKVLVTKPLISACASFNRWACEKAAVPVAWLIHFSECLAFLFVYEPPCFKFSFFHRYFQLFSCRCWRLYSCFYQKNCRVLPRPTRPLGFWVNEFNHPWRLYCLLNTVHCFRTHSPLVMWHLGWQDFV